MKKIIFLSLIVPFLWTCKKGENDPKLSFKSRKARVVGAYKLESGKIDLIKNDPNQANLNQQYSYLINQDSAKVTNLYTIGNTPSSFSFSFKYTLQIKFNSDYTFESTEIMPAGSLDLKGTWAFLNKSSNLKKKEALVLTVNKITGSNQYDGLLFKNMGYNLIYKIDELRNDKMKIYTDKSIYQQPFNPSNNDGEIISEFTLIQ